MICMGCGENTLTKGLHVNHKKIFYQSKFAFYDGHTKNSNSKKSSLIKILKQIESQYAYDVITVLFLAKVANIYKVNKKKIQFVMKLLNLIKN